MPDVSIGAAPLLELMGAVFRSVPVDVYIQKTKIATAAAAIAPPRLVDNNKSAEAIMQNMLPWSSDQGR